MLKSMLNLHFLFCRMTVVYSRQQIMEEFFDNSRVSIYTLCQKSRENRCCQKNLRAMVTRSCLPLILNRCRGKSKCVLIGKLSG